MKIGRMSITEINNRYVRIALGKDACILVEPNKKGETMQDIISDARETVKVSNRHAARITD